MKNLELEIGLFSITFILIYIIYFNILKKNKSKPEKKLPAELKLIIELFKIDVKKIGYNRLCRQVAFVCALDMSVVVTIITVLDGLIWQLIGAIIASTVIILISFIILGKIYKKKGFRKND